MAPTTSIWSVQQDGGAHLGYETAKRGMDVLLSALALLLLSPVLLGVSLAILIFDGRPVLYRQVRIGLNGAPFGMLKFRSMVANADKIGGYQTRSGDPRITRIGGFLRKTSLDELPQLGNVLMGQMSLVGPRPDTPAQEADYDPGDWRERCSVRPGITGLSQVIHKTTNTGKTRTEIDLEYVRTRSIWLDLKILLMTAGFVLRARNE